MSIHLDKRGRRIVISGAGPGIKGLIPGAYETASGAWTVPLSIESCALLKQRFGKRLEPSHELVRWVRAVQQSRREMAALAKQEDAELFNLPDAAPKLAEAMKARTYQRVGVRFIADNPATGIFDDPGLGKTLMVMGGILEADVPGPYLIVAPKTAASSVWKREIERWLPGPHTPVVMPQHRYQREKLLAETVMTAHTWLIIHPEMVQTEEWYICAQCRSRTKTGNKQQVLLDCNHPKNAKTKKQVTHKYPDLFRVKWGAVVVDESHESLIRRSGKTTQRRRGLDMLAGRNDALKIAMSGTPFDSKPHQLWGTLNWLDPVQYSAFHRWAELFWQKGGFTGFEIGEFRQDREVLLWDSISAISLRRTKAEVARDLPPKMEIGSLLDPNDDASPVGIWLDMDGKQADAYAEMEELSIAQLESGTLEATTALAELTRLKQLACAYGDIAKHYVRAHCEAELCRDCARHGWHQEVRYSYRPTLPSNKFDWLVGSLEEWGYPKNPITKVVIVSFYSGILDVFGRELNRYFKRRDTEASLSCSITGKTPSHYRHRIIEKFNSSTTHPSIMLLNVKAGGTAITLDTADRMIFLSETRIPDQQKQAEDRIHRVSNPRTCMYYYLRSLGTVDVGTAMVNQTAIADTHRLLDTRRGVSYMRHVLDQSKVG